MHVCTLLNILDREHQLQHCLYISCLTVIKCSVSSHRCVEDRRGPLTSACCTKPYIFNAFISFIRDAMSGNLVQCCNGENLYASVGYTSREAWTSSNRIWGDFGFASLVGLNLKPEPVTSPSRIGKSQLDKGALKYICLTINSLPHWHIFDVNGVQEQQASINSEIFIFKSGKMALSVVPIPTGYASEHS